MRKQRRAASGWKGQMYRHRHGRLVTTHPSLLVTPHTNKWGIKKKRWSLKLIMKTRDRSNCTKNLKRNKMFGHETQSAGAPIEKCHVIDVRSEFPLQLRLVLMGFYTGDLLIHANNSLYLCKTATHCAILTLPTWTCFPHPWLAKSNDGFFKNSIERWWHLTGNV